MCGIFVFFFLSESVFLLLLSFFSRSLSLPLSRSFQLPLFHRTFSEDLESVMKNLFAPPAAETLALLMLSPRLRKAATVSSSSPSLSPNLTVTTVANESEVLSMTTSGVGTEEEGAAEGASVAGVALLFLFGAEKRIEREEVGKGGRGRGRRRTNERERGWRIGRDPAFEWSIFKHLRSSFALFTHSERCSTSKKLARGGEGIEEKMTRGRKRAAKEGNLSHALGASASKRATSKKRRRRSSSSSFICVLFLTSRRPCVPGTRA